MLDNEHDKQLRELEAGYYREALKQTTPIIAPVQSAGVWVFTSIVHRGRFEDSVYSMIAVFSDVELAKEYAQKYAFHLHGVSDVIWTNESEDESNPDWYCYDNFSDSNSYTLDIHRHSVNSTFENGFPHFLTNNA